MNKDLSAYKVLEDMTNSLILKICWGYLTSKEFQQGAMTIKRNGSNHLRQVWLSEELLESHGLFRYAVKYWLTHALPSSLVLSVDNDWNLNIERAPTLRDTWLYQAAECGDHVALEMLIQMALT
jgi:hypothetical protein